MRPIVVGVVGLLSLLAGSSASGATPPMVMLDRVFADDATVTHGAAPTGYESITDYDLQLPPDRATYLNATGANLVLPAKNTNLCQCTGPGDLMDSATAACPMQGLNRNCGGAGGNPLACVVPYPSEVTDWSTLYEEQIAVEVDYYDLWKFPRIGNNLDDQTLFKNRQEFLIYLQAEFQIINKYLLRDTGVKVLIQHVHFMSYSDLQAVPNRNTLWEVNLAPILPYAKHKPSPVLHMDLTSGDGGGATCRANTRAHPAVGVRWDYHLGNTQDTNCGLRGIIHELTHSLFQVGHTMCYAEPWAYDQEFYGFTYAEEWHNTTPGCWAGESICPAFADVSYQSYSWTCYETGGSAGAVCARLRAGPFLEAYPVDFDPDTPKGSIVPGAMRRQLRYNILKLSCNQDCLTPIGTADLLDPTDFDKDEIPDWEDNCKYQLNNAQMDLFSDGVGNACDGCAVAAPAHPATAVVIPAALLLMLRRKRDPRTET